MKRDFCWVANLGSNPAGPMRFFIGKTKSRQKKVSKKYQIYIAKGFA